MKSQGKLEKLSREFVRHCGNDLAKRCILLPKAVLQGLNVWPDNRNFAKKWIVIISIISLGIMEAAHIVFTVMNITDISKMASACTTVSTTFETMAKLATMLYFRDPLNKILSVIWHEFWPASITSQKCQREIKFRSSYILGISSTFLFMAYISCAQFMAFPLIENVRQLPLQSWYPFDFHKSPIYEIMYIWQWFMNQIVITTLSGFDAFFNSIVMICSTQFQILHEVLENMCTKQKEQWDVIFKREDKKDINEMDVLIKVCNLVESTFSHIVFIQFVVSTLAICVSCVALIADPSLWQHMLSYCIAHLLQFFIYCSVGNELTYQSEQIADAAYNCDWESSENINFKKGLVMVIQRAQKPEALTVAGLMQLSFANFVATVQLSFSFYTLLNSFV